MRDVRLSENDFHFKIKASGALIIDGKILMIYFPPYDNYNFPGGHIELGETSEEGVLREFKEETGLDVKIDKLIMVNEIFFSFKEASHIKTHEIEFMYKLLPADKNFKMQDFEHTENDKNDGIQTNILKWTRLETIKEKYKKIKPEIAEALFKTEEELKYNKVIAYNIE